MKLIIAGTRDFADRFNPWINGGGGKIVARALDHPDTPAPESVDRVISGEARGPDKWGESWAEAHRIPVDRYPPEWSKYEDHRKPAPYFRNREMAVEGDALLAFWDHKSGGTEHMRKVAMEEEIPVYTVPMDKLQTREAMLTNEDVDPMIYKHEPHRNATLQEIAETVS